MYRWWILGCLLLLAVTHTARHSIASAPATTAPPSPLASAQAQEASLLAIEWYTNETVRKALQAEQAGDAENARRFGEKAIESDRKATHIREQTAAAWLQVNDTTRAREVWTRAATMAEERATLLGNRIATMHQLWQRSATQLTFRDANRVRVVTFYSAGPNTFRTRAARPERLRLFLLPQSSMPMSP